MTFKIKVKQKESANFSLTNVNFNKNQIRAFMVSDNSLTITTEDVTSILNKALNSDYVFSVAENSL